MDAISKRVYLCNLHGSAESLRHIRSIWIWNGPFEIHKKLLSKEQKQRVQVNKICEYEKVNGKG